MEHVEHIGHIQKHGTHRTHNDGGDDDDRVDGAVLLSCSYSVPTMLVALRYLPC